MNKNLLKACLLVCAFFSVKSYGQNNAETALRTKQTEAALSYQKKSLAEQEKVLNGQDYKFYGPMYKGSPYFSYSMAWNKGTVVFDNVAYSNISMMYDTYQDQLVVLHYNKFEQYTLTSQQVQSFDMLGHHFVYVDDNPDKHQVKSGFYDELYSGSMQLLARRETSTRDSVANSLSYKNFDHSVTYYLKRGEKFYKVRSRGDVSGVLKDKKKELDKYAKSNSLNFSDEREQSLKKMVAYYEQISR